MASTSIGVIIPAFNEEQAIGNVLKEIPHDWISEVVVVDNNSKDNTSKVAKAGGATVLFEKHQGYGWACLKAMDYYAKKDPIPEIIVFLDADHADFPSQLPEIVKPILTEDYDMVIGSRALGKSEPGAMTPQQIFGNRLATFLIHRFYHVRFTDLGPFRAIKFQKLLELDMQDKTYGWTVEMQIKAAKLGLKTTEVPVNYRKRIGFSKVSGTLIGTLGAGYKILWTIFKYV